MSTADEKNQELSNQPKETKDNLDDLSNKLRRLEDEYHSDKKFVKWGGGLVALVTIAFLGVTVLNIPTKVTEVLDSIVGKETIKVIQEYKAQIEIQATQIAQYATSAENDVNEVKKVTENLPNNALLNFTSCGERYSCTPRACLAKCMELGTRMATYDEVYSWASSGNDHCSIMWMLDSKQSDTPITGYPMYHNQTKANVCGRMDTGDIPRMEGVTSDKSWDSGDGFDCACSGLK